MKMKLKDVPKENTFLMMSSHGYGLCLFQITDTSYDHGIECLNLFTDDIEFHHYLYENEPERVFLVCSNEDAYCLIKMYKD